MFGIFGLGPLELLCLMVLVVAVVLVVVLVVVLTNRSGRTAAPPRRAPDDPLGRIKRQYETLTERERRELLDFLEGDLRRSKPPPQGDIAPSVPPEESTP